MRECLEEAEVKWPNRDDGETGVTRVANGEPDVTRASDGEMGETKAAWEEPESLVRSQACFSKTCSLDSVPTQFVNSCPVQLQCISDAPRGVFQQPVNEKYLVHWLSVLTRPLSAVHNDFCLKHQVTPSINTPQHRGYPTFNDKSVGSFEYPDRTSRD